jgi:predicted ATP-grasp superfamily ATP-dependent carboligase
MGVLLLGADYYGTLAAARAFGRAGMAVTMADENRSARALFSRHVRERMVHPPLSRPDALIEWLVEWGTSHPGTLLYPPNDHLAWLFALERERLSKVFSMYSPDERVIITLLDKKRLHAACSDVGIDVPATFEAHSGRGEVDFPVLVKPRTQVFLQSGIKGFIAHDMNELASELRRFRELVAFDSILSSRYPDIREPILQEYLPAAETSIFSVSGFVTSDPEPAIIARGAMKVLQRPRKVGIGLCFEGRPVEQELVRKLAALCKRVGYFGAFESEFIAIGDRRLLIDFNPRFYSQMGFDIARGLSLPMLVWNAARGEDAALRSEIDTAEAWQANGGEVYCHKTMLDLVLGLQGISGQMTRDEVERWRAWYDRHRATATDAVRDEDDRMPSIVDAAQWVKSFARHPRSFVRSFVLNR